MFKLVDVVELPEALFGLLRSGLLDLWAGGLLWDDGIVTRIGRASVGMAWCDERVRFRGAWLV